MKSTSRKHSLNEGHRARLRQKYLKGGLDAFHDYELLELLLTYAIQRRDVKPLAKTLLEKFKTIERLVDADISEIAVCDGIGENSAILFKLIRELSVVYLRGRLERKDVISSTETFQNYARMKLGGFKEERLLAVYLNSQNQILDSEIMATGSVDCVSVYPRKILERVIELKATGLLLAHNHPGGNLAPSDSDIFMTRQISEIIKPIGVALRDHLIVSRHNCYSLTRIPALMRSEVFQ